MVNDSKRRNYINNSKNSKNKSMSVVMEDSIIKDIKGWELSNESEKIVFRLFVGALQRIWSHCLERVQTRSFSGPYFPVCIP